jgi:hypothetical protein
MISAIGVSHDIFSLEEFNEPPVMFQIMGHHFSAGIGWRMGEHHR